MGEKITLQRGLSELKLLRKRIDSAIETLVVTTTKKGGVTKDNLEELEKRVNAENQSIADLIARHDKIKSELNRANTVIKVKMKTKELTINEVIVQKASLESKKAWLRSMENDIIANAQIVQKANDAMERNLNDVIGNKASSEKNKSEEIIALQEAYRKANETESIIVKGIKEKIAELKEEIEWFETEADFMLSEANNTNFIEI